MENLITEKLILRKAQITDLEMIWKNIWSDEKIAETMLWKPTKTYEEAVERLNKTIQYQTKNYAYFVCLKSNDEPIGFAGIQQKTEGVYEDCGICIAQKEQGKGYAKEVVKALKFLVFEELKGDRFIYGCFSHNEKSKKVCISQGFTYLETGKIVRKWDKKEFIIERYYFDKEMYEKTNDIKIIKGKLIKIGEL